MSAVLLGLKDSEIAEKDRTFYFINKIGGLPDWIKDDSKTPCCQKCQSVMLLVVQLYCPLEGSPYHRTLYLFTCVNKECWNHPHSWQILRSQVLDTPIAKDTKQEKAVLDDDWGVNSEDWDTPNDDWESDSINTGSGCVSDSTYPKKTESDDWGTDANDWGMDTGGVPDIKEDTELNKNICQLKTSDQNQDLDVQKLSCENMKVPSNNLDDINMSCLNVHDFEDDEKEVEVSSVVRSSDDSLISEESVNNMLGLLTTGNQNQSQKNVSMHVEYKCLVSYYIEVVEESAYSSEDTKHVQKLIQQYKQTEHVDLQNTKNTDGDKGAGVSGGESYEKELAVHGDKVFHKFMKKSSICPQQCIRYQWDGTPMFISTPKDKDLLNSRCRHCGEETVFELQLMPALVNVLQIPGISGPATEFGTIIVFTCKYSCWNNEDFYRQEHVFVQSDPDQHLFCK